MDVKDTMEPRSLAKLTVKCDPTVSVTCGFDSQGVLQLCTGDGFLYKYSPSVEFIPSTLIGEFSLTSAPVMDDLVTYYPENIAKICSNDVPIKTVNNLKLSDSEEIEFKEDVGVKNALSQSMMYPKDFADFKRISSEDTLYKPVHNESPANLEF